MKKENFEKLIKTLIEDLNNCKDFDDLLKYVDYFSKFFEKYNEDTIEKSIENLNYSDK